MKSQIFKLLLMNDIPKIIESNIINKKKEKFIFYFKNSINFITKSTKDNCIKQHIEKLLLIVDASLENEIYKLNLIKSDFIFNIVLFMKLIFCIIKFSILLQNFTLK